MVGKKSPSSSGSHPIVAHVSLIVIEADFAKGLDFPPYSGLLSHALAFRREMMDSPLP